MPKRSSRRKEQPAPSPPKPAAELNYAAKEPPRAPLRAHAYIAAIILFAAIPFYWMVTMGTWRLFDAEPFTTLYDAQARSLLQGRWDVPFEVLKFESFVRDGKNYAYFGFVPALMRMPTALLTSTTMDGRWSRFSILVGYVVSLVLAYLLVLRVRPDVASAARGTKFVYGGFVLSLALGSTLFFLSSRSFMYHEALMWGGAFALASYYQLIRYLADPTRWGRLAVACGLAFLAFFTRPSVGGGPVLAVALLALNVFAARWMLPPHRRHARGGTVRAARLALSPAAWLNRWGDNPPPYRQAFAAAATVVVVIGVYVAVNYAKFRTFFNNAPLTMYYEVLVKPERLKGTNGKVLRAVNIRNSIDAYLSPGTIFVRPYFPWVMLRSPRYAELFPEAQYSAIEPHASVTATSPALACLALFGLFAARRPLRGGADSSAPSTTASSATIPLIGAFAGGTLMFAADGLTQRYLHDLFPFVALAGALGVHVVLGARRSTTRRAVWAVLTPLAVWGIVVTMSYTLMYQRLLVWGVQPDRQQQYLRWADYMNEHVSGPLFGYGSE